MVYYRFFVTVRKNKINMCVYVCMCVKNTDVGVGPSTSRRRLGVSHAHVLWACEYHLKHA